MQAQWGTPDYEKKHQRAVTDFEQFIETLS